MIKLCGSGQAELSGEQPSDKTQLALAGVVTAECMHSGRDCRQQAFIYLSQAYIAPTGFNRDWVSTAGETQKEANEGSALVQLTAPNY